MGAAGTISIVIPAYNEAKRLPATLTALEAWADAHPGLIAEVIVVDDGSRDATSSVAHAHRSTIMPVRVVSYLENAGKGYAIRRGVLVAQADVILLYDADSSTPIDQVERCLAELQSCEVVIGSRAVDESLVRVRQRWLRQTMGRTFNRLVQAITSIPFRDTQCGFKLLTREAARRIFERASIDRFAFDVEMILLANRFGYRVAEVPVEWHNSPDSRVHIVRDSLRMLADVTRARLRHGRYRAGAVRPSAVPDNR